MSCMAKGYLKGNGKAMQHSIVRSSLTGCTFGGVYAFCILLACQLRVSVYMLGPLLLC